MIRSSAWNLSPGIEHKEPFFRLKVTFCHGNLDPIERPYSRTNSRRTPATERSFDAKGSAGGKGPWLNYYSLFFFFFNIISVIVTLK